MTPRAAGNPVLERALAYARLGWPVFPCRPGRKVPATAHGHLDATTDEQQIADWFTTPPDRNLAVATGLPGPDVLDIDARPSGTGFDALTRLARAGLTSGAATWVRTPGGGIHAYFAGSDQRSGSLPAHHLDFKARGGFVLVPPSRINGRCYQVIETTGRNGRLDWLQVTAVLNPDRRHRRQPAPTTDRQPSADIGRLTTWVARLAEGNRNQGLFWAANRVLEAGQLDLDSLAEAARKAGLGDQEITATLASARRTTRPLRRTSADQQAEQEN
jgi:hypothetical protein